MDSYSGTVITVNDYALISFIAYLLLMLAIGIWSAKFSSQGISEFFLGGRKMNKVVVALSAVVSGRSSWLLLGLSGMAYVRGISAIWAAVGYIITEYLMFRYAAPKLREHTERNNDLTIPDYFESRFNDNTHLLRFLSAIIIIVFMTAYISAQFVGGGKAFAASFGFDNNTGILLTAVIVFAYTVLGGFMAVSFTDVVQAIFMLFALVVLPVLVIIDAGSPSIVINEILKLNSGLLDLFSLSAGALISFLSIGFGSPGNPHILVRYMSIKNARELKFSAYLGTFWNIVMALAAVIIGVVGRYYFPNQSMLPNADSENLFPLLAQQHLHPVLFGIVIAAVFAAIMSTADSMLLVTASSFIRDIYQKILKPGKTLSEKELVLYSRIIVASVVVLALLFGFFASDLVFWLVLFAWGGLGAAFGPAIILSLFWKGTTRKGVAAGLITGLLTIIIWNQTPVLKSLVYELTPGFILSFLAVVIVSKIEGKNS